MTSALSNLAQRILGHLHNAAARGPEHRPLTIAELGDELTTDRRVLDRALGDLDEFGLIRIRGDVTTYRSYVELTPAGDQALVEILPWRRTSQ